MHSPFMNFQSIFALCDEIETNFDLFKIFFSFTLPCWLHTYEFFCDFVCITYMIPSYGLWIEPSVVPLLWSETLTCVTVLLFWVCTSVCCVDFVTHECVCTNLYRYIISSWFFVSSINYPFTGESDRLNVICTEHSKHAISANVKGKTNWVVVARKKFKCKILFSGNCNKNSLIFFFF